MAAMPTNATPTIVVPMAGLGSRFSDAGYSVAKPFIDVNGAPMIHRVLDNLSLPDARFILLMRDHHLRDHPDQVERLKARGNVTIRAIDRLTDGPACTVLLGEDLIGKETPLLIANCDQLIDFSCAAYFSDCLARDLDGSILVFKDKDRDPKWSFARLDSNGHVVETREKQPISDLATVGLYLYRRGADFINSTRRMIAAEDRVNNEFYVCPGYNYLIADNLKIGVYEVAPDAMHGLGTPEDLAQYLALEPAP